MNTKVFSPALLVALTVLGSRALPGGADTPQADPSKATAAPKPAVVALSQNFANPQNVEPQTIVNARSIRTTIYTDPMHCSMRGLLTPLQMTQAEQVCADRYFHIDHSN